MRRAQARVGHGLLQEMLGLSEDVEVLAVWQDPTDRLHETFRVLLGGGDLPTVAEGEEPSYLPIGWNGKVTS